MTVVHLKKPSVSALYAAKKVVDEYESLKIEKNNLFIKTDNSVAVN